MNDDERALVEARHREAGEKPLAAARPPVERSGVHYTQLSEAKPGEPFFHEWNTYRREVGRLLHQGLDGRYVLIKGETIIGIYETWDAARQTGLQRFLLDSFFVHLIRAEEPFLRIRGLNLLCPS
jgi:hypothetical protein